MIVYGVWVREGGIWRGCQYVLGRRRLVGGMEREADLLFRKTVGVREGIESRTHLNMRPQIRHILGVGCAK
jgi:hypothetical protein